MRALILGTGSIGRRHVRTLQALEPESEFILLRRDRCEDELSRSLGARVTASLEEALAHEPAVAVIATPSALHLEALLPLVDARIPFYVEKPVVTTRAQLDSLSRSLDRTGFSAPTLAGCNLRYLPSLRKLKELLDAGAIGRVVRASLQAGQWLPDWRPGRDYRADYSADPDRGGGVLLDLIHEFDQVRWLLGEFDEVRALAGKFSALEIRSEDAAAVLLGRKGAGPVVAVGLDYVSRRPVRRYEFVGEEGSLVWDFGQRCLTRMDATIVERIDGGTDGFETKDTHAAAMREFLQCARAGRATSQDVREGMRSAELAIRAKEACGA